MKRIVAILLVLLMAIAGLSASAAMAFPNQQLSFRTGPNTRYTELFTLPQSTSITPLELEEGNGVMWVMCEFTYKGNTYHGYTGLKRMDLVGNIMVADHIFRNACMIQGCSVYTAPSSNAAVRGKVGQYELVNYLRSENGYDYIEFYDSASKSPSRGWVNTNYVDLSDCAASFMTEASSVYAEASSSSRKVGKVGKYEMVGYVGTVGGYDLITFYSASLKELTLGYVPTSIVDAYGY